MVVERQPGPHRAVLQHLEVGHRPVDAARRPARVGEAHRRGQARERRAGEVGRAAAGERSPPSSGTCRGGGSSHRRRGPRRAPARAGRGPAPARRCRPTTGRRRPAAPRRGASITSARSAAHGGEVVAVVGLGRAAVAALVDGDHGVARGGQRCRDAVPEAGVRGEAVDEQERPTRSLPALSQRRRWRRTPPVTTALSSRIVPTFA